jgi:acetyl-CoA acyltransferase
VRLLFQLTNSYSEFAGASGTRLMTTLVGTMRRRGARYALQTMCEAGGLANATVLERR